MNAAGNHVTSPLMRTGTTHCTLAATSAIVVGLHEVLERDECTPQAVARAVAQGVERRRNEEQDSPGDQR